jgi:hypothetical protein
MPLVYLHIGLPKTGTSALQVFFAKNAAAFGASGIRYVWASAQVGAKNLISSGNGLKFAREAAEQGIEKAPSSAGLAGLMSASKSPILLSSEFFAAWTPEIYKDFAKLCADHGFKVKVIAYLKEQSAIMVGHYFQQLKRSPNVGPEGIDFARFAQQYLQTRRYLDFERLLSELADIYGRDMVVAHSTKPAMLNGGLLNDFMNVVGVAESGSFNFKIPRINLTPRQPEMYMRSIWNKFSPSVPFSDMYLEMLDRYYLTSRQQDSEPNYFVDQKVVSDFRAHFSESNKRVCKTWFDGRVPEEVFEYRDYPPIIKFSYDNTDLESIIAVMGGLIVALSNRIDALEGRKRGVARLSPIVTALLNRPNKKTEAV